MLEQMGMPSKKENIRLAILLELIKNAPDVVRTSPTRMESLGPLSRVLADKVID